MAPWMARLPPGQGRGEGGAHGGPGKGRLIPRLTDGGGLPVAPRPTLATGDERAHVLPWLAAVKVRTGNRGRPRNRLQGIAPDQGDDATALRQQRRKRGSRAQRPKRGWQTKKNRGSPSNTVGPRC